MGSGVTAPNGGGIGGIGLAIRLDEMADGRLRLD